jgi:hypothetical protein
MQKRSLLLGFLANKTGEAAGNKLARIKPLERFFSRNLQRTNSSSFDILYSGPAGGSLPSKSSILWLYSL